MAKGKANNPGDNGTPRLVRTAFRTSRLLDFFSEKELVVQCGHGKHDWPLVVLKELLDNALDACEDAGTPPRIGVKVDGQAIEVRDNGPGLPPDVVEGVLDFGSRISTREAYVSPTRGAQGNALKTLLAMPFVLDGQRGRVVIEACGTRHVVIVKVDHVRQEPVIEHNRGVSSEQSGTFVRVCWPELASEILQDARARFLQIASDYTFLNPHLTLTVDWQGEQTITKAARPAWSKWLPSDPTCPHWYTPERLERLIVAHLVHGAEHGRDRTVRELVAEFRGLAGSAKQKQVLRQTGLTRAGLSVFRSGDGVDRRQVARLLAAMQRSTRAVKPAALGVIGKEHLAARFAALGCDPRTLQYRKAADATDAVPRVIETAFAECPQARTRRLVTGVNWSPGIVSPFRQLGRFGLSLDALLERQKVGRDTPAVVLLHLACPRVEYTDRGKSAVILGDTGEEE